MTEAWCGDVIHPWLMLHALDRQLIGRTRHVGLATARISKLQSWLLVENTISYFTKNSSPKRVSENILSEKQATQLLNLIDLNFRSTNVSLKGFRLLLLDSRVTFNRFIFIKMGIGQLFWRAAFFQMQRRLPGMLCGSTNTLQNTHVFINYYY